VGTTVEDAVQAVRNRLQDTTRDRQNLLAAAVDDAVGIWSFADDLEGITSGALLGCDYEIVYVRSRNASTGAVVVRGQRGTDAADHAEGAVVEVRPRYAKGLIRQALLEELRGWPPELYRVDTTTVTATAGRRGVSTGLVGDTELIDVLRVWRTPGAADTSEGYGLLDWASMASGPASLGPGVAIQLDRALGADTSLFIEYMAPFVLDTFEADTDLVGDVGLAPSMFDVAWQGAALRVLSEVGRTDVSAQQESRLAEEVPPGHITSVRRDLERDYHRARQREVQRLLRKHPYRMVG
jgi:hypothetical protein